ncbi:MAG TPA: SAV_2336 N-terminal domain-related protein, partial [Umezawaea sp.]|nr:SAV_2336 N-terminal domain-related protein [Umezawaea sp.]
MSPPEETERAWTAVRAAVAQASGSPPESDDDISTDALSFRELRDAMWLALELSGPDAVTSFDATAWYRPPANAGGSEPAATPTGDGATGGIDEDREIPQDEGSEETSASRLREWAVSGGGSANGRASDGSTLGASSAWPTIPALPERSQIARALRPLMRGSPSPRDVELDEVATAVRAAQDRLWVPECRPTSWRPLEVAVVVDRSSSMPIWQQTAREFRDLLAHQGAFRDVRLHYADFSANSPSDLLLHHEAADARPMSWKRLADPTGRRLVLVLSDMVGDAWYSGAAEHVLHHWGQRTPVAVVHVLEQRLWHWGGLVVRRVRLSAPTAGSPNANFRVLPAEQDFAFPDSTEQGAVAIPVLGLAGPWFAGWARLLSTPGAGWVETTAAMVGPCGGDDVRDHEDDAAPPSARDRVLEFRTVASTAAFRLA